MPGGRCRVRAVSASGVGAVPGVSAGGLLGFRAGRGRRGMGVVCGARSAPWGGGRAGGRPGEPGNSGLWGVPGFPWSLQASSSGRRGTVLAAGAVHFPRSFVRRSVSLGGGVWGTWNRGRGLAGGGGGSGFPRAFPDWSSLVSVYSRSRAVVFPTSPSLLFEGVRSGAQRRRGASASAQAAGGTGPGTRRAAPAHAGVALYGHCVGRVAGL